MFYMLISFFYLNYRLSHIRGDSKRGHDKRKGNKGTGEDARLARPQDL